MDRVLISWNLVNWITVVLMVVIGFLALGLVSQLLLHQFPMSGGAVTDVGSGY